MSCTYSVHLRLGKDKAFFIIKMSVVIQDVTIDINLGVESSLTMASYDRLSHLMADHNDLLILRTFSSLNIKNLLYYQAELANLECELREIESEDQSCRSSPRQEYAASWKILSAGPEVHSFALSTSPVRNVRDALQWQLFRRIRAVRREYSKQSDPLITNPVEPYS
jgi:hypothetical protein